LQNFVRAELALRLKPIIQEKAKENQIQSGGAVPQKSAKPIETRIEIAKLAGVSHDTIDKTEKILEKGTTDQIQRAREGGKGNSVNAIFQEIREITETKTCIVCGQEKSLSEFWNISTAQRCNLVLILEPIVQAKAKAKQKSTTLVGRGVQKKDMVNPISDEPLNTNNELAKAAGVGHNTIHQLRIHEVDL
jgi:DNA-binding XRE family transcriptional regulator